MSLLLSDISLIGKIRDFLSNANDIVLFVPYIQCDILSDLINGFSDKCKTIITSWKPQDVALGVSDLKVYPYCKKNNITLLINNRIHLKAYVIDNFSKCIVSSSNISAGGLALKNDFNYELGVSVNNLSLEDKVYFDMIIEESHSVNDVYYKKINEVLNKLTLKKNMPDNFKISTWECDRDFLITSLPMSNDVNALYDIYRGNKNYFEEDLRAAFHDLRIYQMPLKKNKNEFIKVLKNNFFKHPFICSFLEFNGDGKYFGELTQWIHNRCTTVPTPRRFEVKEALKRIYIFATYLSDQYEIIIPASHSEMLKKNNI